MIAAPSRSSSGHLGWAGSAHRFWHRHPERTLAAVALLAWGLLFVLSGGHTHRGGWLRSQNLWVLMVAAMMVPPALPMARHVAQNSKRHRRQRAVFLFGGASLLLWLGVGLVVVNLAKLTGASDQPRWLLGSSLLLAALWEFTPAKRRALIACHRTLPLPPDGRKADRACVQLGLQYGKACFKACWALMLPMALVGHVGPVLMLLLTGIAVAEEVVRKGYRMAPAAAVVLCVSGLMVLVLG